MSRRSTRIFWGAWVVLGAALLPVRSQERTVGLMLDDPRSFPGYTLFAPLRYTATYLIDNQGRLVHSWPSDALPGDAAYLAEDGRLLRTAQMSNPVFDAGGAGGRVQELDWDGAVLWDFTYSSSQHLSHHDVERLPNGNVLLIAWELWPRTQAIAAGRNPSLVTAQGLWPDHVIEVEPVGPTSGIIVWEWHVRDHLIQDFDPTRANFGDVSAHPELIDLNHAAGPVADWTHINSIDYEPTFDQILLSVHNFDELWIIDHSTTTQQAAGHSGGNGGRGGDLLYRWGNPQTYRAGTAADQKLFGQHDTQWILPGRPGEGHISVFNNGQGRPSGAYSSVEEVAPPVDESGHYALAPGAAYGPAVADWTYAASPATSFYAANISGAERLANGNTLICDGPEGTFFEVTPSGETVWEYVNPVTQDGPLAQGDPIPPGSSNRVFKIRRYAGDYAGLAGRDLRPGCTVEIDACHAILRNAVADLSEPLSEHLPLDPVRDHHSTATASPFVVTGDAGPTAAPLIFYGVPDASLLTLTRSGSDVVLSFTF